MDRDDVQQAIKKAIQQRNRFITLSGILFTIIIVAVVVGCKLFVFGSTAPTAMVETVRFEMKDERTFAYQFRIASVNQVDNSTSMTAPDELGRVYIKINTVFVSPFHSQRTETKGSNRYDKEIRAVYLQGKEKNDVVVLWEKE